MRTLYNDMDIRFFLGGIQIRALNIVFERFTRTIPAHSHGNGCYEIHYIPAGYGKLRANGSFYDIVPNTLFVTGPHVEHAQTPAQQDPMQEYCIYLKFDHPSRGKSASPTVESFLSVPFWFGRDGQDIHTLMLRLFAELRQRYTGYQEQVSLLLSQLVIYMVRNYEQRQISSTSFAPKNLTDAKSVIIEEYFLYEYQSLSLGALADRLKLSPRQTQRLLMESYGKSFQQKKAEARMSAAAILLSDPERSITSIAEVLGYSSGEHFSGAFKSYYHMCPRDYRRLSLQPKPRGTEPSMP